MTNILDLTLEELKTELAALGEPAYRAEQIFSWLYKRGMARFEDMTNLAKPLRDTLSRGFTIGALELFGRSRAKDHTEKFVFRLAEGPCVESVLIPSGGRMTLCLSTQAGCRRACAFCASGLNGFIRNLMPSEIVGQVLYLRNRIEGGLTNIVFMGMGEPFDNYDNLVKAIRILNAPQGLEIAARRMTVSTAGLIPGILKFKDLGLQVNLSVSIHASSDEVRTRLMPVNKKYPLEKLIAACQDYIEAGGRKITLEYILIRGLNDALEDGDGLARIAARLRAKINLIPYSHVAGLPFETPDEPSIQDFVKWIQDKGAPVTLRHSKGRDIQAACGQLAGILSKGNL